MTTQRIVTKVGKWENGRTPNDGAPDSYDELVMWYNENGEVILDPEELQKLAQELMYERLFLS